ncbi:hypothetical protein D6D17_03687 [Aureobasidium pullulans]|nr:hypothetical protein D6D17_03687 [Aureobasidium pullulans]
MDLLVERLDVLLDEFFSGSGESCAHSLGITRVARTIMHLDRLVDQGYGWAERGVVMDFESEGFDIVLFPRIPCLSDR